MIRSITEVIERTAILPQDGQDIDAEATLASYCESLTAELRQAFPDAHVDVRIGIGRSDIDADTEAECRDVYDIAEWHFRRAGWYVCQDGTRI